RTRPRLRRRAHRQPRLGELAGGARPPRAGEPRAGAVDRDGHARPGGREPRRPGALPGRRPHRRRPPRAVGRADLGADARGGGRMSALVIAAREKRMLPVPTWIRERGMGASLLVAVIASAFGVVLVEATA